MCDLSATSIYEVISRSGGFPVHSSHRGGCETYGPENTMNSFRRSVACKTRLLEIDLRVTKDLHLVIMHDDDVDRTTNGVGLVSSFTLSEIKLLDAAKNYPELEGKGIDIPTFSEFLDEFLPIDNLLFMLDFKDIVSVDLALQVVNERKMGHRIILGSVDQECNAMLGKLKPKDVPLITDVSATLAIVSSYYTGFLNWYTFQHNIFGYILTTGTSMFWSKGLVDAMHNVGCKVLVCGEALDREEIQRECIEFGVDFIMSDRPDILAQTMRSCKLMD